MRDNETVDGDKRDRLTGRGKPHPCGCGRPVPQSFVRHPGWSGDGVWISTFNVWDGAIGYVDTCGTCAKEAEQATSRELNY